ncbi:uncharacterized protein DEA37_0009850, partial [Paragonimus westermani]
MQPTTAQLISQRGVRKEIHVIMATMPLNMQTDIGNAIFGLVTEHGKNKEQLTDRIKRYLDRIYGRAWQVVLGDGSNWVGFTHIPETAFFFQLDSYVYLIWKTRE